MCLFHNLNERTHIQREQSPDTKLIAKPMCNPDPGSRAQQSKTYEPSIGTSKQVGLVLITSRHSHIEANDLMRVVILSRLNTSQPYGSMVTWLNQKQIAQNAKSMFWATQTNYRHWRPFSNNRLPLGVPWLRMPGRGRLRGVEALSKLASASWGLNRSMTSLSFPSCRWLLYIGMMSQNFTSATKLKKTKKTLALCLFVQSRMDGW